MPLYLGADDYGAKIRVHFLKSFHKRHIWENLSKKKLKKRRAHDPSMPCTFRFVATRVFHHWCLTSSRKTTPTGVPSPSKKMLFYRWIYECLSRFTFKTMIFLDGEIPTCTLNFFFNEIRAVRILKKIITKNLYICIKKTKTTYIDSDQTKGTQLTVLRFLCHGYCWIGLTYIVVAAWNCGARA
jgi:hypothetical protein